MTTADPLALLEKSGSFAYKGMLILPAYSPWGAYPRIYYTREFESLCSDCATTEYFGWLYSLNTCDGWQYDPPVHVDVYYEGPDVICADCSKPIPSAYGDPWADDDANESGA